MRFFSIVVTCSCIQQRQRMKYAEYLFSCCSDEGVKNTTVNRTYNTDIEETLEKSLKI